MPTVTRLLIATLTMATLPWPHSPWLHLLWLYLPWPHYRGHTNHGYTYHGYTYYGSDYRCAHDQPQSAQDAIEYCFLVGMPVVCVSISCLALAYPIKGERLCGKQGLYGRPARPKRLVGRGWPKLGGA